MRQPREREHAAKHSYPKWGRRLNGAASPGRESAGAARAQGSDSRAFAVTYDVFTWAGRSASFV